MVLDHKRKEAWLGTLAGVMVLVEATHPWSLSTYSHNQGTHQVQVGERGALPRRGLLGAEGVPEEGHRVLMAGQTGSNPRPPQVLLPEQKGCGWSETKGQQRRWDQTATSVGMGFPPAAGFPALPPKFPSFHLKMRCRTRSSLPRPSKRVKWRLGGGCRGGVGGCVACVGGGGTGRTTQRERRGEGRGEPERVIPRVGRHRDGPSACFPSRHLPGETNGQRRRGTPRHTPPHTLPPQSGRASPAVRGG